MVVLMTKIGRNNRCPCGSGKKYKKCCLAKDGLARKTSSTQIATIDVLSGLLSTSRSTRNQNAETSQDCEKTADFFSSSPIKPVMLDEVKAMDSETIIRRLRSLGVPFNRDAFILLVSKCFTIEDVFDAWDNTYTLNKEGQNDDFIFVAVWVLWDRIAPQMPNVEKIEEMIEEAYEKELVSRCDQWLSAWKLLKNRSPPDIKSIEDVYPGGWNDLEAWCIDIVRDLVDAAGEDNPRFYRHRLHFCKEFIDRYPKSREGVIEIMNLGRAESFFMVKKAIEGDRAFQALTTSNPENARYYMRWGDMYWFDIVPGATHESTERAKAMYQIAKSKDKTGRLNDELNERIAEMEDE
jgi:hypothetical protein